MKADKKDLNRLLKEAGYKFLGWQNGWKSVMLDAEGKVTDDPHKYRKHGGFDKTLHPEYSKCRDQGHPVDSTQHTQTGSENTVSCDICKIYWKYDCSD